MGQEIRYFFLEDMTILCSSTECHSLPCCTVTYATEAALLVEGKDAYCGIIVHTISYLPYSGVMMFLWSSFVFTLTLRSVLLLPGT